MPVGIENLATGFLQGLNARKQQERQDVIDQREAERFDMQKEQFAEQQAANQLSLKTNQFQLGQAQAKAEREKILQEKEDNFRKQWEGFARPFAMGNDQEGYNALEKTYNDVGYMGKGAFKRDAQGNVLLDDKGNITFLTYGADGKPTSKSLNKDKMIEGFINSYDPLKHWEHEQKTAEEIAKEDRLFKKEVKLVGLNAANAERLARLQKSLTPPRKEVFDGEDGTYVINAETGIPTPVVNPSTGKPLVSNKDGKKDFSDNLLSLFEKVETTTDKYGGNIKQTKVKDVEKINEFVLWANENNEPLTFSGYSKWVSSKAKKPQVDGLNAASQQLKIVNYLKGQNITTQEQAAKSIKELRSKGWADEQIKAAFSELGL
jgi:predicted CopG family antitoxin